jgi:hypothetical protein
VSKISKQGDFLSKLHDLQSSDPAKFQAKMKEMSDHLRAEAQEKGGAAAAKLNAQADKVDAAAKSGDLSGLQPPGAGKGAHRGHHAHSEAARPRRPRRAPRATPPARPRAGTRIPPTPTATARSPQRSWRRMTSATPPWPDAATQKAPPRLATSDHVSPPGGLFSFP